MPRPFTETERTRARAALLDAGRHAARTTGMRRTPVEQLTRAAGISKGAFYLFFESKEAMVFELLFEVEATLRASLQLTATTGPVEGRFAAVLRQLVGRAAGHPLLRAIADPEEWTWLATALPPGALEAAQADDDAFFAGLVEQLIADGALQPGFQARWLTGLAGVRLASAAHAALPGLERGEAAWEAVIDAMVGWWRPAPSEAGGR